MVNRLLGALAEDDIYSRTLFHRWGDFLERLFLGAYAEGAGSGSIRDEDHRHMGEELGAPLAAVRGAEPRGGTEPRG